MQTFLPSPNFAYIAQVLDWRRANKQIIESRQIGLAITNPDYGWQSHPAVNMWRGHVAGLLHYTSFFADAYQNGIDADVYCLGGTTRIRRKASGRAHKAWTNMLADHPGVDPDPLDVPVWAQNHIVYNRVLRSHRSMLVKKVPEYYGQFWVQQDDDYYWPV